MSYCTGPLDPLPPKVRTSTLIAASIFSVLALAVLASACSFLALSFGWHPLPHTTFGCSLHKKFRAGDGRIDFEQLFPDDDCLIVSEGSAIGRWWTRSKCMRSGRGSETAARSGLNTWGGSQKPE